MNLNFLQDAIANNRVSDSLIIFVLEKETPNKLFLANQYVNAIAKVKKVPVTYLDNLETTSEEDELFDSIETLSYKPVRVCRIKQIDIKNDSLMHEDRLILIVDKVSVNKELPSDVIEFFDSQTIKIPTLEEWQILDYILSKAEGLNEDTAKWLYNLYSGDIFRINMELEKLELFTNYEQGKLIDIFKKDEIFEDIPKESIFEITNALSRRDIEKLSLIYKYRDVLVKPGSEMGFIALVYKTFKNLILVKTAKNPTPEALGLTSGQIWTIRNIPNAYTNAELLKIFDIVSDLDRKIKNGEFDTQAVNIVDYILIKILTI